MCDSGQRAETQGQRQEVISAIAAWWAYRQGQRSARRQAFRHLAVVAQALYTGSTAAYHLTPDLPRASDSTHVEFWQDV